MFKNIKNKRLALALSILAITVSSTINVAFAEALTGSISINGSVPPVLELDVIAQNLELNFNRNRNAITVTDQLIGQLHIRSNVSFNLSVVGSTATGMPENETSNQPANLTAYSLKFGDNAAGGICESIPAGTEALAEDLTSSESFDIVGTSAGVGVGAAPAVPYDVQAQGAVDDYCDITMSYTLSDKMPAAGYYQQDLVFTLTAA